MGGWVAVLGSGLLLGCIISLMELIEQPMAGTSLSAVWIFLSAKGGYWMGVGMVWAILVQLAEPRFGTTALTLLGLLAAIVMSLALLIPTAMSRLAWFGASGSVGSAMDVLPMDARLAHLLWTICFYGGLYLAVFTGVRRAARTRKVLARMQQARDESAMLLEEGQLEAFRRQLQPRAVTDALAALRALYRSNPSRADDLVDLLVDFLRPAVRSLQAEATTLSAELDLAVRYLRLRSATTGEACSILADSSPVPETPFPPRLLVPALERFCLAGRGVRLTMGRGDDGYRVELEAEVLAEGAIPVELGEDMTLSRSQGAWRLSGRLAPLGEGVRWTLVVSPLAIRAMPVMGD
ncbi:MAG: histidine kinase [Caulobacteraceae bacterium]